uniref:Cyclic nucleotide-binding domain-containing protein n=1 Tax=Kalanchoe fedtschenkoi TaxID=63787 RepID=A0A7N0V7F3_KALFE
MAGLEKDDIPMLSDTCPPLEHEHGDSKFRSFGSRSRSVSMSTATSYVVDSYSNNTSGHTGPLRPDRRHSPVNRRAADRNFQFTEKETVLNVADPVTDKYMSFDGTKYKDWQDDNYARNNEHLYKSGQLGLCNDPYCTTCPTYYNFQDAKRNNSRDQTFHSALYGDAKGWARRSCSFLNEYIPGVMNPHAKIIQQWNKFFVISCLVAIFVDPLFFFLLSVDVKYKCVVINWPITTAMVVFRSLTDFVYLLHILLQFRLAFVSPESTVVGAGDLVDQPKEIALNYLSGFFMIDLFIVLPLPQIIILLILPRHLGTSGANFAKNLLRGAVLVQYIPRLYRFMPLLAGQSPSGFIFESAWANFVINLLTFVLAGHVVGSCWYLLGLQRVNQCLRNACTDSGSINCIGLIDCGHGKPDPAEPGRQEWAQYINASGCFQPDGFPYGIYVQAVNLTTHHDFIKRYVYSLFWGFQQISTLAGNQVPSYFVWEVLFTMTIIGLGLLLFALLIGNMQNFLQALGRRQLEMSLRRRDVEQWMSHRRLPEVLRRQVRESERYNWAATRGVNEEMLLENLPEDLQRGIRRHLFNFVQKVRIFSLMDEPILDSICERLRQKTYIKGSKILFTNGLVEKMVFIVRGKMDSCGEDGNKVTLSEGDVCGEELLSWCLEHSSVNKDAKKLRILGQRLVSNRMVTCLTNVEAFTLRAADIEEVTSLFSRFLRNPRVQGAIRYESPYWRGLAARRIQVAWRYRKKRLNRMDQM